MHGRSLSTNGSTAEQAHTGEKDFAEGNPQGEYAGTRSIVMHGQCSNGLGNTASFRAFKDIAGQPGDQGQAKRGQGVGQ